MPKTKGIVRRAVAGAGNIVDALTWLEVDDVLDRAECTPDHLWRAVAAGECPRPHFRQGVPLFDAGEIADWIDRMAAEPRPADLAKFSHLIRQGETEAAANLADKLGLSDAQAEVFALIVTTATELEQAAADLPAARLEMERTHERPATTALGLDIARSEAQSRAMCRLSTAEHAARGLDALRVFWPSLFGVVDDRRTAATYDIPAAVLNRAGELGVPIPHRRRPRI